MADAGAQRALRRFRALLVDYGGVMTTSMGRAFAAFCQEAEVDPEVFKAVIADAYGGADPDGMVARLERGQMPMEEFEAWLAERLSAGRAAGALDPTGLRDRLFAGMEADPAMVEAVARARAAGVRTVLVSNSWGTGRYEREWFPELFNAVVVSGDVGLRKPEPEIFREAARRVGVDPHSCVFVDDLLHNVEGAKAVGMEAFVHRSAEFTVPKLEGLFEVGLH